MGFVRQYGFHRRPRDLTKALDLDGRVFLHSYDYREDPTNRLLEVILTGPQVVAQWINMEHYFSTVDNEVYGSGSKIYHNVVGRIGIMSGPWSDLRLGFAWQTVMNGEVPYHEPMRLLTVIEAPRERSRNSSRAMRCCSIFIITSGCTSSRWNRRKVYFTGIDRRENG